MRWKRSVGLLNTHTEMKHTNANSILSILIYASLETIVALAVLLIRLMNHWQRRPEFDWTAADYRLHPDSNQIRKRCWENNICIHDSFPVETVRCQVAQQHPEVTRQRNDTRNPCASVDVSGKSMGKVDTGSTWTGLMGWGWVVAGVVKTCSDGALNVRNTMRNNMF